MKTTHTPEQWVVGETRPEKTMVGTYRQQVYKKEAEQILSVFGKTEKETQSRAVLAASAPDLLEALQRFIAFADKINKAHNDGFESSMVLQAKAAVAKATYEKEANHEI